MKNLKKKLCRFILGITYVMANSYITVFALDGDGSGTTESAEDAAMTVVKPIYTIINIFILALQAVGIFLFIKGISELATAIKQQDDSGAASAVKGIIAGAILIFIKTILTACGITW